jgi:AraC family transcriptional regulator of adaptative response/methylated-DNA-[protein]-cysteine methyltransferase
MTTTRSSTSSARPFATDAARWDALRTRDRSADGFFYYGVRTTGIYCRPSCGARRAQPQHILFYDDIAAAQAAGLRPCKRCRPGAPAPSDRAAALVAEACRRIEQATEMPNLAALARTAKLSQFHFHRLFKQRTGLTPRAYMNATRAQHVRAALQRGSSVTGAIFEAGYSSSSRFYEHSARALGMMPSAYRDGGAGEQIHYALTACSLGQALVATTDRGICAILLGDDATELLAELQQRFRRAHLIAAGAPFEQSVAKVVALVEHPAAGLDLPLDLRGTAFQHRVWQALRAVPAGTTVSYGEIARRLGVPNCARAVGRAVGSNPVAIAVPCHRVIASDGSLSGYRWGRSRKQALLARERSAT